jgi:hypothetical protein
MMTFKISLAFFFYRILQDRWQLILLLSIVSVSFLVGVMYFFITVFQCGVPGHGGSFWLKKITGRCLGRAVDIGTSYPHAIINALTDVILCAMPIHMVWKARLSRREKMIVSGILVLAAVYLAHLYITSVVADISQ